MKVRKKPVIVEAFQVPGETPDWFLKQYREGNIFYKAGKLTIRTLEGNMTVKNKDWIIQGVKGELYPCKPDIFKETYEIIGDDNND